MERGRRKSNKALDLPKVLFEQSSIREAHQNDALILPVREYTVIGQTPDGQDIEYRDMWVQADYLVQVKGPQVGMSQSSETLDQAAGFESPAEKAPKPRGPLRHRIEKAAIVMSPLAIYVAFTQESPVQMPHDIYTAVKTAGNVLRHLT